MSRDAAPRGTPAEAARLIAQVDLLAALDAQAQQTLAAEAVFETHARGAALFLEGDDADGLRIVADGLLRVWISDANGKEITLSLVEPGDALGEIALLDGAPRSAGASAMEATRTLLIRRASFRRLLEAAPALQGEIIILLCQRLRGATHQLGALALTSLRRQVARKLVDLAQSHAVAAGGSARFRRRFSQSDLAEMLGATREAVNKQLAALAVDGLVAWEGRVMILPALDALEEAASSGI